MLDNVTEIKLIMQSRCRPAVPNETILATTQEFFFAKIALVQSITDIVLLGFWLMLLSWMFFLSYTTIYVFIFQWIRPSNVFIWFLVEKGAVN